MFLDFRLALAIGRAEFLEDVNEYNWGRSRRDEGCNSEFRKLS